MAKDCNVGVKGVVCVGAHCLLLQKDAYWDIPGGRIDGDETLEETLKRELSEELPTLGDYTVGDLLGAYRLPKNIGDDKGLVLLFYRIEAAPFDVELSDEHTGYEWVGKSDLEKILTSKREIEPGYYNAISRALELG